LKFYKLKIYFYKNLSKQLVSTFIFLFSSITLGCDFINAEYFSEEIQIDTSTKTENDSSVIPTNPFEIVEMIRRYNSLNDATNPSDAIDDALKSFNSLEDK
jgi:hypothetical protein